MNSYEAPALIRIGTVANVTQGDLFQEGQDHLSWLPIIGRHIGDRDGGGFGS